MNGRMRSHKSPAWQENIKKEIPGSAGAGGAAPVIPAELPRVVRSSGELGFVSPTIEFLDVFLYLFLQMHSALRGFNTSGASEKMA